MLLPLPGAGTAVPGWGSAAWSAPPLPGAGWPEACPLAGRAGADPAGGAPGTCGPAGGVVFAGGVLDAGGVLVRGDVGSGSLGSGWLGSGSLGSGSLGSGLLPCDGGCDGVDSLEPDGEGLGVVEEPSRLSSTSSRPRVSEPCDDGAVDAAGDNPVAACEAGTPAVAASRAPSPTAAAPRRRPRWRPVFVVDTLDLKITMVIEPSRNRPAGKTCKIRGIQAGNPRDRRDSGCPWRRCDSCG